MYPRPWIHIFAGKTLGTENFGTKPSFVVETHNFEIRSRSADITIRNGRRTRKLG